MCSILLGASTASGTCCMSTRMKCVCGLCQAGLCCGCLAVAVDFIKRVHRNYHSYYQSAITLHSAEFNAELVAGTPGCIVVEEFICRGC